MSSFLAAAAASEWEMSARDAERVNGRCVVGLEVCGKEKESPLVVGDVNALTVDCLREGEEE